MKVGDWVEVTVAGKFLGQSAKIVRKSVWPGIFEVEFEFLRHGIYPRKAIFREEDLKVTKEV